MPTGRVVFYVEGRRFGFIKPDDGGADVFVHGDHLVNIDTLIKDQRVSFEIVHDDRRRKPRADNVRVKRGNSIIEHNNLFLLMSS